MKNCRHCGQSNYLEDSNFCCNGCQEAFKIIKEWVNQANEGNLPEDQDGDYGIENLELNAGKPFITFNANSSRYQNLQWQM